MMPMPMGGGQPPMGGGGAPPMPPPGGGGGGEAPPNPKEVEAMIVQVVGKLRSIAEGAGLDFDAIVARGGGNAKPVGKMPPPPGMGRSPGGATPGRPPMPPMGM